MCQDMHHWWNDCFWRKVFSKRFAPLYFFFNPLYSFTFLVWDGLNNAFDYWPIVVDDTCKYGVFKEVRIVKFFNPFVTQGKSVAYLDKIWRDMHSNVPCHIRRILFWILLILILYAYIYIYIYIYILFGNLLLYNGGNHYRGNSGCVH
jgi:hypothetical protein